MVRIGPWRLTRIQHASNKHRNGPTTTPDRGGGMGVRPARMALLMGKDIAYDVEDGSWMGIPSLDSLSCFAIAYCTQSRCSGVAKKAVVILLIIPSPPLIFVCAIRVRFNSIDAGHLEGVSTVKSCGSASDPIVLRGAPKFNGVKKRNSFIPPLPLISKGSIEDDDSNNRLGPGSLLTPYPPIPYPSELQSHHRGTDQHGRGPPITGPAPWSGGQAQPQRKTTP
jgi:hypothetical protein